MRDKHLPITEVTHLAIGKALQFAAPLAAVGVQPFPPDAQDEQMRWRSEVCLQQMLIHSWQYGTHGVYKTFDARHKKTARVDSPRSASANE